MRNVSSRSVKVFYPPTDRAHLVVLLQRRTAELNRALPLTRAVLFGSWAKGRATAFSDIDVLVIYADPPRDDAYKLVRRSLCLRGLEPHVYAESEARGLRSILDAMIRGGLDLLPRERPGPTDPGEASPAADAPRFRQAVDGHKPPASG